MQQPPPSLASGLCQARTASQQHCGCLSASSGGPGQSWDQGHLQKLQRIIAPLFVQAAEPSWLLSMWERETSCVCTSTFVVHWQKGQLSTLNSLLMASH